MPEFRMFKYPLFNMRATGREDTVTFVMAPVPQIRHVAMQNGWITLWVANHSDLPSRPCRFLVAGTGQVIPSDAAYLGTVMDGIFVWHVFEVPA
jgi:hypothetical protein